MNLLKGMKSEIVRSGVKKGGTVHSIRSRFLHDLAIPVPPLAEQELLVAELEGYRRIIEAARQIVAHYKPTFRLDPKWPTQMVGALVRINNGGVLTKFDRDGKLACIKVSDMNLPANQSEITTSSHWANAAAHDIVPENSVIFPKRVAAIATNKKRLTKISCVIDNNCMALTVIKPDVLDSSYLFYFLRGFDLASISNSAGVALINNGDINSVEIPIPPLDVQREIVAELESERRLVDANRELIARMEKKIQGRLTEIWGESAEVAQ